MNVKGLFVFLLSLLGIVLVASGLYNLVGPMIPFGPLGMIIIGLIIVFLVGYVGGRKILS